MELEKRILMKIFASDVEQYGFYFLSFYFSSYVVFL